MTCNLSEDALFILNLLYTRRCLAKDAGYITQIRKKDIKYYISDIKLTSVALGSHGYSVTKGRVRPL
jgi:hypothetical protein